MGYPRDKKGYRIWLSSTRQIIHARDVKFIENNEMKSRNVSDLDNVFTPLETTTEGDKNQMRIVEFLPNQEKENPTDGRNESTPPDIEVRPEREQTRAPGGPRLLRTGQQRTVEETFSHTYASQ